jgi:pilus assembly protein CpaB
MITPMSAPFDRLWPASGRRRTVRAWRRALAGRPRVVALAAVAAAFAGGVHLAPSFAAPDGEQVVVAAADLPAGHRVQDGDLAVALWPNGDRPAGVLLRPQGRVLAAPVRRGEPLTDVRMVDGDLLRGLPNGLRAVPVRLADAPATLLRPGRHLDVLAGSTDAGVSLGAVSDSSDNDAVAAAGHLFGTVVVADALLLTVPATAGAEQDLMVGSAVSDGSAGTLVVLAVDGDAATRLAAVAGRRLTVALRS